MSLSPQEEQKLADTLKFMMGALKSMALYPQGHPSVHRPLTACYEALAPLLRLMGKLSMTSMEGILIFAERPFYDTNIHAAELLKRLEDRSVNHVEFIDGMTMQELGEFLNVLQIDPAKLEAAGGLTKELKKRNVEYIRSSNAGQVYDNAIGAVEDILREARMGRIPSTEDAAEVVEEMKDLVLTDKGALVGLSLIKSYDEYLFNHSVNVSVLSLALADEVEVPKEHLSDIGLGALLHDIGKVETPKEIIRKPGKLNPEEWDIMREHPVKSHEIVKKMTGISEMAARIVYEHHVRFDHKGYPSLSEGQKTHPYSQIVTIADTYDAMTTLRTYQNAFNPKEALDLMEQKLVGATIDPVYFDGFVKLLGIYPVGTLVRLDTNEIALVIDVRPDNYLLPKVKIVMDPAGKRLPEPVEMELARIDPAAGETPRNIISTVDPLLANIDTSQYL